MNQYEKFKHILEYFVAHLEWLINSNEHGRGYKTYISPLNAKNEFFATGQGYKGGNIQSHIKNWCNFENGEICINIQASYGNYKTVKSYLNWLDTGINVIARWKGNQINSLALEEYHYWNKPPNRVDLKINKSITELELFDDKSPNDTLKSFFDKFNSLIIDWNKIVQYKLYMENIQHFTKLLEQVYNLILTGAPGTGKTFLAKQIAKQMINVKTDEELDLSGQFAFVQFHPSYDYTDFVEGIRPTPPDDSGYIGFERKDGIFKDFCKEALKANFSNEVDNFDEVWKQLLEMVKDNLANGKLTKIGSWTYGLSSKQSLKYSSVNTPSQYTFTITKQNVYYAYQNIKARPSGAFQKDMEDVVGFMKKELQLKDYQPGAVSQIAENKKFVFVIDEINRGEISKIFGELFFSIDPSYRGKKGAIKTQFANMHDDVNEVFFVPDNVYIIGTMNDIDRSVENFDFAMRRRFTWKEITAEQSAENMNLPEEIKGRMAKLNDQISKIEGLNASYHIGGAYFLDKNGIPRTDYDTIWDLRLEPLLKEYLRGIPDGNEKIEKLKSVFNAE